jgi:membrane-associated phospholipid phosphatase
MTRDAALAFFRAVTILGDSTVLLPATAALALILFATGARRNAVAFAAAAALCVGGTIVAKIGFMACSPAGAAAHSPSGHAALSTFYYFSLGLVATTLDPPALRRALIALCCALAPLVALSRIALHAHTPTETLIGALVGGAAALLFRRFARWDAPLRKRYAALGLLSLGLPYLFFEGHSTMEEPLESLGRFIAPWLGCAGNIDE